MYLTKIKIENFKSLSYVEWEIEPEQAAGWHTILGVNGTGKSSFVQATALCLLGPRAGYRLGIVPEQFCRVGTDLTTLSLAIARTEGDQRRAPHAKDQVLTIERNGDMKGNAPKNPNTVKGRRPDPIRGWLSCAYGSIRRFGPIGTYSQYNDNDIVVERFKSAFDTSFDLRNGVEWLVYLGYRALEKDQESEDKLRNITEFVNQSGFLDGAVTLKEVGSSGVFFEDRLGSRIRINQLSDGYRSVLAMMFDLLHRVSDQFVSSDMFSIDGERIIVSAPGVVLIDEIDAHLHPTWQRKIGEFFTTAFPNMQFIVTTHSPFVVQASAKGSVFLLEPGEEGVTGRMVEGEELRRLVWGDIREALGTSAFQTFVTRSEESLRLAEAAAQEKAKRAVEEAGELSVMEIQGEEPVGAEPDEVAFAESEELAEGDRALSFTELMDLADEITKRTSQVTEL